MIHIVTAYTRTPEFLDRIYESIKSLNIDYHWYIVTPNSDLDFTKYQNTTKLVKPDSMPMHTGVNYYYDVIPDTGQWVYILDDDNLIHPNFPIVNNYIHSLNCDMVVFGQQLDSTNTRYVFNSEGINIQKIDNGQFLLRRTAVGKLRYWPIYRGDGYFATEMRIVTIENGREVMILPIIASYYNAQHWLKS